MKQHAFIHHLSSFIENVSDAISLLEVVPGPRFRYIDVNRACERYNGLPREAIIGKYLDEILDDKGHELFLKWFEKAESRKQSVHFEGDYPINRDQNMFDTTLAPLFDANNECKHLLLFSRDITRRKLMETQLLESERKHRQLVESFPEGIIIICDDTLVYVNPSGELLLGAANSEQLIGRSVYDFILPAEQESAKVYFRGLLVNPGSPITEQHRIVRLDGTYLDAQTTGFSFEYAGKPAVMSVLRDVSSMVKMQEELDHFFNLSQQLICICTFDGQTVVTNPAWESMLGYLNEDTLQDNFLCSIVHPDDLGPIQAAGAQFKCGSSVMHFESRLRHKKGHYRLIRWNASVLPERGTVYATGTDITDQHAQQELLQKSEKLSIVGQLAAGIAHEIRNPLTSLKGFLQLFRSKLGKEKKYEDYFSIMFNEFSRIEEIVGEFLILAKPQPKSFKPMPIDLLLRDIVKLLDIQAILNNVQIFTDVEAGLPPICCDENQLKQVFVNILKNAIEAMPYGGMIMVSARRNDSGELSLRFTDQGPGIAKGQLAKLGEPFYTTKEGGTGLGLMICHRIIESHQGSISISSEVGQGTTVEIVLPPAAPHYLTEVSQPLSS
ncbi:PAS domain S-box protein [Paenibacillus sp. MBLB4367]|uniref:PAS domain S-box protein n=1 Tax=Paenibacillus sp. MBLB4367 TaxID=3384767 RepID=UPI0039081EE7